MQQSASSETPQNLNDGRQYDCCVKPAKPAGHRDPWWWHGDTMENQRRYDTRYDSTHWCERSGVWPCDCYVKECDVPRGERHGHPVHPHKSKNTIKHADGCKCTAVPFDPEGERRGGSGRGQGCKGKQKVLSPFEIAVETDGEVIQSTSDIQATQDALDTEVNASPTYAKLMSLKSDLKAARARAAVDVDLDSLVVEGMVFPTLEFSVPFLTLLEVGRLSLE